MVSRVTGAVSRRHQVQEIRLVERRERGERVLPVDN